MKGVRTWRARVSDLLGGPTGPRSVRSVWASGFLTAAALSALVIFDQSTTWIPNRPATSWLKRIAATVQNPDLNRADQDEEIAGYYEGLLDEGSHLASGEKFIGRAWALGAFGRGPARLVEYERSRGDFLFYDLKPHVETMDGGALFKTNSDGMADREYSKKKPLRTRRIAFLGDSLVRGLGAPFGESLEALLEQRLNQESLGPGIDRVEVLNFGVEAYGITQLVDVALEKAAEFEPDVYLVALTPLTVSGAWSRHLENLVRSRIDLKYDFLRQLAVSARLKPTDNVRVTRAKLAAFRVPAFRWALETIAAHAERQGATLAVAFVPHVTDSDLLWSDDFGGVGTLVAQRGIPLLDLREAFVGTRVDDFRMRETNGHPNAGGYARLCDLAFRQMSANPTLLRIFRGTP